MPARIDQTSGLIYTVKRPVENKTYSVDFRFIMPTSQTIASVSSTEVQPSGLVTETTALVVESTSISGTTIAAKLSGGTDGEDYEVKFVFVDGAGDIHSEDIMVKVRKAGDQ